ncbi:MAG TPA: hypothetical protein VII11_06870 [Bacteroidota bacterium]
MLPTLAIVFVLMLLGLIFYGFSIVMRRPPTADELRTEKCSLCGERFPKEELAERQIGDYKLNYFCQTCVTGLHEEMEGKDLPLPLNSKKLISEIEGKKN